MSFIDTVEATKWKKYDSDTSMVEGGKFNYKTYIKGSDQMRVDISHKKVVLTKTYLTQKKTGISLVTRDNKGKTITKDFTKTKMDLKTFYKHFKKRLKNSK
jgi:hypothetical protein